MQKTDNKLIEVEGIVKEILPGAKFRVEIDVSGKKHEVEGYLSGKMRKFYIRIMVGDKVKMQISPYSPRIGRIVYRTVDKS